MNKLLLVLVASAFVGTTLSAFAADDMKHSKDMMTKMMDANSDGMISKDEFMKHHEKMYEGMKKNKEGMVDMKDMQMMHDGMMKDNAIEAPLWTRRCAPWCGGAGSWQSFH